MKKIIVLAVLTALVSSCVHVAPYERDALASKEMTWSPDSMKSTLDSHVFFSKEASSGGTAAAGGGCGCN
ncbi:DUF4266 domain-containing protein [Marinicellulosiphila megalodicopiae]|uniref:DUF4266 domain-containing protein n=1 Tax=Marinicellulosiphila megalodicopiae TaxID=2724896 RepID=UPI003BB074F8